MNKISTENLELLPKSKDLQKLCKSISALEAIICQDWEYRYFSYENDWSDTEEFCEMRNGEGDQLLIAFSYRGTCMSGFAHESEMNGWRKIIVEEKKSFIQKLFGMSSEPKTELIQEIPKGVVDSLPEVFDDFIFDEPVKSIGTTFCIWQTKSDSQWQTGDLELPNNSYKDGSSDLLQLLDGHPLTYKNWAEEYYDETFENRKLNIELVEEIYKGARITKEIVFAINPDLEDIEQLKSDLDGMGYENDL